MWIYVWTLEIPLSLQYLESRASFGNIARTVVLIKWPPHCSEQVTRKYVRLSSAKHSFLIAQELKIIPYFLFRILFTGYFDHDHNYLSVLIICWHVLSVATNFHYDYTQLAVLYVLLPTGSKEAELFPSA